MVSFITMMSSIVDLFFFPAACILDMFLCTVLLWIFFTISHAFGTVFVMHSCFPEFSCFLLIHLLCIVALLMSLHCNEICLSSSTLLNIVVRLSIISSPLSFSYSDFHLGLLLDLLFFILRIAFFTSSCVISFLSTLGSSSMIF